MPAMGGGSSKQEGGKKRPSTSSQGGEEAASSLGGEKTAPTNAPAPEVAPELHQPLVVLAHTVGGEDTTVELSTADTVMTLRTKIAEKIDLPVRQIKLAHEGQILKDTQSLGADLGFAETTEISVIKMPPVPEFADALGLTCEHPELLRRYVSLHGLESLDEVSDAQIWKKLEEEKVKREDNKKNLAGWGHWVQLYRKGSGEPAGITQARPGEAIAIEVKGEIHNNKGDSCIHQLVLALDKEIVGELNNSVPGRGQKIAKSVAFKAPQDPGVYMLWRKGDLQYNMRDARRNFENGPGKEVKNRYPQDFVGWVVVEEEQAREGNAAP